MPLATPARDPQRDDLIANHLELAKRVARSISRRTPNTIQSDELVSAAYLGLTEAANRFDPTRGEPFIAYATKRVRGAVLDELRKNDVLTRRGRESARRLADATREVEREKGRAANSDEIADAMGVTLEQISKYRAELQSPSLIPLEDAHDLPHSTVEQAPDQQCVRSEQKRGIAGALRALPKRDLMVLSMYYRDGLTLKEIGEILCISESRVCQVRTRALRTLRKSVD